MNWLAAQRCIKAFDPHYGMTLSDQRVIFDHLVGLKEPVIVELGVCHGRTAGLLAYCAKELKGEYHGIDNWQLEGSAQEVQGRLDALGLSGHLYQTNTQDLFWDIPIDVLLIDAGHDEPNIRADCAKWVPHVKPGGIVIFDDWPMVSDSPHWAVQLYGNLATGDWEDLVTTDRIKIRRR